MGLTRFQRRRANPDGPELHLIMPAFPQFYASPALGVGLLTTAETDMTGTPGDAASVLVAGVNGTRVDQVVAIGTLAGAQAAKIVRLWLVLDSGPTWYLFDEIVLAAATQSATVASQRGSNTYTNLVLPTGYSLRATVSVSELVKVIATGGHY